MNKIKEEFIMKTIRGIKIYLLMIAMTIATTSCVQSTSSSSKTKDSASTSEGQEEEVQATVTTYADPQSDEITYYDDEDEDETEDLPGVAYSDCGVIYKQMNNDNIFFKDSDNDVLIVQQYSYESASTLNEIKVNNDNYSDSYNACLEGYIENGVVYLDSGTLSSVAPNPTKPYASSYTYEYCGYIAHTTYSSNNFTLLSISSIDFKINNQTGESYISSIPTLGVKVSSENAIEACVYSNRSSYDHNSSTFYDNIDAKVIDLGAYGVMN